MLQARRGRGGGGGAVERYVRVQRDRVRREEPRADELPLPVAGEGGELVVDRVLGEHVQVGDAHLGVVADEGAPEGVHPAGALGELRGRLWPPSARVVRRGARSARGSCPVRNGKQGFNTIRQK